MDEPIIKSANKTIESLLTPIPIIWIWAAAYRVCFGQAPVNKLVLAHCFRGQCGDLRITITITMSKWWQSLLAVIRQLQLDIGCLGYATVYQRPLVTVVLESYFKHLF